MSLVVSGICKAFGGLQVLQDVSFSVGMNERAGIVGPNGAGKSTLFALITGFMKQDSGGVYFDGHNLSRTSPVVRSRLGLLRTFQVPRPYFHLTVHQNLLAAAPSQIGERLTHVFFSPGRVRIEEQAIHAQADEILSFLRLKPVADYPANQLSGGQLKLLELGRLLMTKPKFIMIDEPFAGVNPVLIEQLCAHIRALNDRGLGCLIIEHNLRALSNLVPRLIVLDCGRIIADGSPTEVLSNPEVQNAYVGGGP